MFENVSRSCTASEATSRMSPELYDPERFGIRDYRPTKQSNRSPLEMIMHEVSVNVITDLPRRRWTYIPSSSSRKRTLWSIANKGVMINTIVRGDRPQKPETAECLGFTKELW
jgi:hypothetical protein